MLRMYVAMQRARDKKPGFVFFFLMSIWNTFLLASGRTTFPTERFMQANKLPCGFTDRHCIESKSVGILVLAARKDLVMLPHSISAAVSSIGHQDSEVYTTVILPSEDIGRCQELLIGFKNISLVEEESLLDHEFRICLRERFKDRYGWALQQFLKVAFVLKSDLDGVFVVDADTVLIGKRDWLCENGSQKLTPSDEYNPSYYEFLSTRGVGSLNPKFTFVSHHMLMQPWILREAFAFAGWKNLKDLLLSVNSHKFLNDTSPFSIDFELYAQYLYQAYPDRVSLEKWCNLGIPREEDLDSQIRSSISRYSHQFSSISFHSYL